MEFVWKCPPDQIPTDRTRGPRDTTKLSESPCVSSSGLLLATCRKSVRSCKQPGSVCFVVWNLLARSSSSSTRVCPFSVCSHARAPNAHHRRRGHESSHTLRWYWWGWMVRVVAKGYSVQCCCLTLSRFSDNTSDQRRGISLRWEDVVMGGLNGKLFSRFISQPSTHHPHDEEEQYWANWGRKGRNSLRLLSLVSISSTRIVLQLLLLLFVDHLAVQLCRSLACPTHFNSITVTSSVLISNSFTSLQKQRNQKEE